MANGILAVLAPPSPSETVAVKVKGEGTVYLGSGPSSLFLPEDLVEGAFTDKGNEAVRYVTVYTDLPELGTVSTLASPQKPQPGSWLAGYAEVVRRRLSRLLGAELEVSVFPLTGSVGDGRVLAQTVELAPSFKDGSGKTVSGASAWIAAGGALVAYTLALWGSGSGLRAFALLTHYIPDGEGARDVMAGVPVPVPDPREDMWNGFYVLAFHAPPPGAGEASIKASYVGVPAGIKFFKQRKPPSPATFRVCLRPAAGLTSILARDVTADAVERAETETEKLLFRGEGQYALTVAPPGAPCAYQYLL